MANSFEESRLFLNKILAFLCLMFKVTTSPSKTNQINPKTKLPLSAVNYVFAPSPLATTRAASCIVMVTVAAAVPMVTNAKVCSSFKYAESDIENSAHVSNRVTPHRIRRNSIVTFFRLCAHSNMATYCLRYSLLTVNRPRKSGQARSSPPSSLHDLEWSLCPTDVSSHLLSVYRPSLPHPVDNSCGSIWIPGAYPTSSSTSECNSRFPRTFKL